MSVNLAIILKERILQLEKKRDEDLVNLKLSFNQTCQSLKPMNIIKNALDSSFNTEGVKDTLLQTLAGMVAGFITNKIVVKNPDSVLGKGLGVVIQMVLSGLALKNTDRIRKLANDVLGYGINLVKGKDTEEESEEWEEDPA